MPRRGENIHKRKDGRWEGRYIKKHDIDGKAIYGSVYAKTYLDVKRKLIEMNKMALDNTLPPKEQKIAFREVLYLWLENNRIKLKQQTYADYKYMIESHIIPSVGSTPVCKIDARYINSFLLNKSKNGRLDGKGGLSASYIKKLSFIILAAFEYAVKEKYCEPLYGDIMRPAKKKKELEVLSVTEQIRLEHYLMVDFNDRKLGVLLSLYAGLRIGEVCGLRWCDIDFETQTIHIRHTVERIKNIDADTNESKTKLILGDTKTISSNPLFPYHQSCYVYWSNNGKMEMLFCLKAVHMSTPIQEPINIAFKII